jgi:hypothetical protein
MENFKPEELAEKCLEIICNEHIDKQRQVLEILKEYIEENWQNMNDAAMEDFSFGI